jgi:hypothetical protein
METSLIPYSVDLPDAASVGGVQLKCLVPVNRLAVANRTSRRSSDTTYFGGTLVWSSSAGGGGPFHWYAPPLKSRRNSKDSNQWRTYSSEPGPDSRLLNTHSAIACYAFYSCLFAPMSPHVVNAYV